VDVIEAPRGELLGKIINQFMGYGNEKTGYMAVSTEIPTIIVATLTSP
jgi:hypothetical protein